MSKELRRSGSTRPTQVVQHGNSPEGSERTEHIRSLYPARDLFVRVFLQRRQFLAQRRDDLIFGRFRQGYANFK